jgi:alkyl hydroperoxide reductase subunit AhpC
MALSVDSAASHENWIGDIEETQGSKINFPILADADRKVSTLYDMIHPEANDTLTARSVFVIDPKKKIRLIITYPASAGRNFDEILRVIDSLQLTEYHSGRCTPAQIRQLAHSAAAEARLEKRARFPQARVRSRAPAR